MLIFTKELLKEILILLVLLRVAVVLIPKPLRIIFSKTTKFLFRAVAKGIAHHIEATKIGEVEVKTEKPAQTEQADNVILLSKKSKKKRNNIS